MVDKNWSSEQLAETLKVLWNETAPEEEQLNFKDDHILAWYLGSSMFERPDEFPLYIQVLHAGMHKYWGGRQTEILVRVLTFTSANVLERAFPSTRSDGKIRWEPNLEERFLDQMRANTGVPPVGLPSTDKPPITTSQPPTVIPPKGSRLPRNYGNNKLPTGPHRISLAEIWNPGNQLGFGWKCDCHEGLMCSGAVRRMSHPHAAQDVAGVLNRHSMFSLAIPILSQVLHRVTVFHLLSEDWEGNRVSEIQVDIPTGLGAQVRYYQMADWLAFAVNPVSDITSLLVNEMLGTTAEGQAHIKITEDYADGRFRSTICSYKSHNIGTNQALLNKLRNSTPRGRIQLANAFCMLHLNMCIVCATNNELALMVPSQV